MSRKHLALAFRMQLISFQLFVLIIKIVHLAFSFKAAIAFNIYT